MGVVGGVDDVGGNGDGAYAGCAGCGAIEEVLYAVALCNAVALVALFAEEETESQARTPPKSRGLPGSRSVELPFTQ